MATKSTKVGKGTLKSASGRGVEIKSKPAAKPAATAIKSALGKPSEVSARGSTIKVGKAQTASAIAIKPADLKKTSARGGKECLIENEKLSGASIKVKVDGANLKKSLKN